MSMDIFTALAQPTRRNIVEMLAAKGQLSVAEIGKNFKSSPPAISQHLKVLRDTNLVRMEKYAQKHLYSINPVAMSDLEVWAKKLQRVWNNRFDRLDQLLKVSPIGRSSFGRKKKG